MESQQCTERRRLSAGSSLPAQQLGVRLEVLSDYYHGEILEYILRQLLQKKTA